jgi:hypothetical protein
MGSALFQRIQTSFQSNGGVMQSDAEMIRLLTTLDSTAEGATIDANTVILLFLGKFLNFRRL